VPITPGGWQPSQHYEDDSNTAPAEPADLTPPTPQPYQAEPVDLAPPVHPARPLTGAAVRR